jgi:curved DNA-binding protein CbpA
MSAATSSDPFRVLGLPPDAGEVEVRARYLELVKKFPPDREPERFREIRAAYEAAKDPLSIAKRLIAPPGEDIPQWSTVLQAQRQNPPRLSASFLLSLGNRVAEAPPTAPPSG